MKKKVLDFKNLILGNDIGIIPAGLSYSFFLALIPIATIIFFIFTSLDLSLDVIEGFIQQSLPTDVANLVQPILTESITFNSIITLVVGLFVATNGLHAIVLASNAIYDISNSSYIKRMIKSFILTIIMILLFTFVLFVPLLGTSIISLLGTFGTFVSDNEFVINVIFMTFGIPISLLVVFVFIKLMYTIAPDQRIPSKHVNKGALFTTIGWVLSTFIYSYYINNIANFSLVYGNLANIVILLLWLYLLSYIFVIGIFLNKSAVETAIEKTNTIKLDEIRKKVKSKSVKSKEDKIKDE